MNHLQKKCLVVSAGFHGLLIGVTIFGAAFFVPVEKFTPSVPIKVYYPDEVADTPTRARPTVKVTAPIVPTIKTMAVAPPIPQPEPVNPPPAPQPEPTKAPSIPEPEPTKAPTPTFHDEPPPPDPPKPHPRRKRDKPAPEKKEKPNPPVDEPVTEPTTEPTTAPDRPAPKLEHQVVIDKGSLTPIVRSSPHKSHKPVPDEDDQAAADAQAEADYRAAQARATAARAEAIRRVGEISRMARNLTGESSSSTKVEISGGEGADAFSANYRDIVAGVYHGAWHQHRPNSISDKTTKVEVRVTIARDGRVVGKHVLKPSGNADMDRSVERTLDSVKFVEVFPSGTKDQERSFIITFDLEADQQ